jgi:hypothetical protein
VAILGASSFTYAQATWTQGLADWISGHVGAFEAIGVVPALLVPDNTKVAVIKACLYDPQINRSYADLAAHYDTAILPARPRRPRDKAKVEQAVLMVERWLSWRLRHRIFHSLAEVNAAIAEMLSRLNEERPIRRLGVTRRKLLEEIDRWALKALPRALTCSPSGGSAGSASTITSRSRRITTASRIASSAPRSRCASLPAPSRFSTRASGSSRISA